MRTVLNSLVPKLSDWAEEAWNRAQILPTSLTGDVTSDKADFPTLYNSLQDFTGKEVGVKVSLTSNK